MQVATQLVRHFGRIRDFHIARRAVAREMHLEFSRCVFGNPSTFRPAVR
jgi:hypothetical protein